MFKKLALALLLTCTGFAPSCQQQESPLSPPEPVKPANKTSYLLVLWAQKSSIKANADDKTYTLTLYDVDPHVMGFTDRPQRKGSFYELDTFITNWNTGTDSFASNPPNAGLVALAPKKSDPQTNLTVTLTNPIYNARKGTLTFTMTSIDPTQSVPLGSFRETILFLDSLFGGSGGGFH